MYINGYQGQGLVNTIMAPKTSVFGGNVDNGSGGLRISQPDEQALAADSAFADELIRRVALSTPQVVEELGDQPAKPKDATGLRNALRDGVAYVRDTFGDDAAAAFKGVVFKELAGKELNEDTLGFGLVKGMAFLDKQFGAAAGDELIKEFNGNLNQELNAYFDNGRNEKFLVGMSDPGTSQGLNLELNPVATQTDNGGDDDTPSLIELLTQDLLPTEETLPTETPAAAANPYAEVLQQDPALLATGQNLNIQV